MEQNVELCLENTWYYNIIVSQLGRSRSGGLTLDLGASAVGGQSRAHRLVWEEVAASGSRNAGEREWPGKAGAKSALWDEMVWALFAFDDSADRLVRRDEATGATLDASILHRTCDSRAQATDWNYGGASNCTMHSHGSSDERDEKAAQIRRHDTKELKVSEG